MSGSTHHTTLYLIDFDHCISHQVKLLIRKFQTQQKGFLLYLENRRLHFENPDRFKFLPLEFTDDKEVFEFVISNGKKNPIAQKFFYWYLEYNLRLEYYFQLCEDSPFHVKNNPQIVKDCCMIFPNMFQFASKELRNNREFVLSNIEPYQVKIGETLLPYLDELASDRLFFTHKEMIARMNSTDLKHLLPKEFHNDIEILKHFSCLESFPDELKSNRELVLNCVKKNRYQFKYATDDLKQDVDFILECSLFANIIEFIKPEFRNHREIVKRSILIHGSAMMYASEELKNDDLFVREMLQLAVNGIEYIFPKMKEDSIDRDLVLQTVRKSGGVLCYCPYIYRNDYEIVWEAISNFPSALEAASDVLINDKSIVTHAVKKECKAFLFASNELQHDKEFIESLLENNNNCQNFMRLLDPTLKRDKQFIIRLLKNDSILKSVLIEASELKNDIEVVEAAVKYKGSFFGASDRLTNDERLWKVRNPNVKIGREEMNFLILKNRNIVMELVKKNGFLLYHAPLHRKDETISEIAAKQNGFCFFPKREKFEKLRKIRMTETYFDCKIPNHFLIPLVEK
ncbi:predicted protein [Naegleria gruberi]|uniref:Predicted protein n=1 Tax=Naegleria gruberi TaxID=5762 RepID=D2VGX8_NAEGR|nr:uncharacterized protein NAEGRDRAFT_68205 [Naegleria gruberi]EFC43882.1 predicted protein [Naegleria gruberi]|eukprot:XP_002676626.1 predicted protein [Naegleria gruberi strain NEG-M]